MIKRGKKIDLENIFNVDEKRKKKFSLRNKPKCFDFIFEIFIFNVFLIFVMVIFFQGILGYSFLCSINATEDCTGSFLPVILLENETGGYDNAHAQNVTNLGFLNVYNYSVCCYSDSGLDNSCRDEVVLRMFNYSNSHVQIGNYTGPYDIYNYDVCLSSEQAKLSCVYENNPGSNSCLSSGYECLASIASSETAYNNQSNAHIGECNEYSLKICCSIDNPSNVSNVRLVSDFGTNYTYENLSVYFLQNDDSSKYTNITDWRLEGNSIALVNLPFDLQVDGASGNVKDYSTFSHNGTLATSTSTPVWTENGKVGGAYYFVTDDYLSIPHTDTFNFSDKQEFSFSIWAKLDLGGYSTMGIVGAGNPYNVGGKGLLLDYNHSGTNRFYFNVANGSTSKVCYLSDVFGWGENEWKHIFVNINRTSGVLNPYIDGIAQTSCDISTVSGGEWGNSDWGIGRYGNVGSYYGWNGTLDEFQVFNKTLSEDQIIVMYESGGAGHSVQKLANEETVKHQNWSVVVTPNDIYNDGLSVESNVLSIRNSLPEIILNYPEDSINIYNRTFVLNWTAIDYDNDDLTFDFNLTAYKISGAYICNDRINEQSLILNNYEILTDLRCFYDWGYQYNWSVRGNDGEGYGGWTQDSQFNLTAVVSISLADNSVIFGDVDIWGYNDTVDDSPEPFKLQNDGNVKINVSVTSTDLWKSLTNPNQYYQFKIRENESNSYNKTYSFENWTQFLSYGINTTAIIDFNYQDENDRADFDIYVKVPPSEQPGNKNATITFIGRLTE